MRRKLGLSWFILFFTQVPWIQVGRASQRKRSGIPMSTGTSREASPQRYTPSRPGRTVGRPPIKPVMTEKILKQSREAESALADALVSNLQQKSNINLEHLLFNV